MSAKILTREAILGAQDIKVENVKVPEWNDGVVRLRSMPGTDRDKWETVVQSKVQDGKVNIDGMKVLLIVSCAIDDKGDPLFTENDLVELNKKNAKAINRLWEVAARMNGIGNEELEELRKNS